MIMPAIIGHGAVCGVAGVAARAAVAEKNISITAAIRPHRYAENINM